MKRFILFILAFISGLFSVEVYSQSAFQNYVQTRIFQSADMKDSLYVDEIQYYDDLGRETQLVRKKFSAAGLDMLSGIEYDAYGRRWREVVPVQSLHADGGYEANLLERAAAFTGDASPYKEISYEDSPLSRILAVTDAGAAWHSAGKKKRTSYFVNDTGAGSLLSARCYTVDADYKLVSSALYVAGELRVTLTVGEDNDSTFTFTDKQEHTVLMRQRGKGVSYDTYYAYNDYGLLCYVLPPALEGKTDATSLAMLGFSYKYDDRDRCIEKKLPGCDPIYMVYDNADHLVLEQNGVQREKNRWTVHKYDGLGRLLYSFEHTDATSVATLRERLKNLCAEEKDSGTDTWGIGYTNATINWGSDVRLILVNYYDDYKFLESLSSAEKSSIAYQVKSGYDTRSDYADGLQTGARSYFLDGSGKYTVSANYYDRKGRLVQHHSMNVRGGSEKEYFAYRFSGKPLRHHYYHNGGNGGSIYAGEYAYSYDAAERLTEVQYSLNGGNPVVLYSNSYDGYGRLQKRSYNRDSYSSSYTYNIRNWLTGISGSKFTQNLYYNTGKGTPCYGGSISSMTWKAGSESTLRGYKFSYDGLNRLLTAAYGEGSTISTNANRFTEQITGYDKNGNITGLKRYGQIGASTYGLFDNLTMTLNGNQLKAVNDVATASAYNNGFEFKNGITATQEYSYDKNGNLTQDLNKDISKIEYNLLNLPLKVTFKDGSTISYVYGGDGAKLKTIHKIGSTTTTTEYCDKVVYENGTAKRLQTEVGYLSLPDNKHHFYLQDHQGNNRVVINEAGNAEEVNHYYPFGGLYANSTNVQPYKYNGKELDRKKGLNWYDYGARMYDAALGRFMTIDPLAEKYFSVNPFGYCLNNPIRFIDPKGKEVQIPPGNGWNPSLEKKERLNELVSITNSAGKKVFEGSGISASGSVWAVKGKFGLGLIKGEAEAGLINCSGEFSKGEFTATGTLLKANASLSVQSLSTNLNASVVDTSITIGNNTNAEFNWGTANAEAQIGTKYNAKVSSDATIGAGLKINVIEASISVNLEAALQWVNGAINTIVEVLTPELDVQSWIDKDK